MDRETEYHFERLSAELIATQTMLAALITATDSNAIYGKKSLQLLSNIAADQARDEIYPPGPDEPDPASGADQAIERIRHLNSQVLRVLQANLAFAEKRTR